MGKTIVKARGSVVKRGTYEFTEDEIHAKGIDITHLLRRKKEEESKLKEIKSEFKSKMDKIDTDIEKASNDIVTGQRTEDMECIVYLDQRDGKWYMVYESVEHGHEVGADLFDYARHSHLFGFTEKRDIDNAIKNIYWNDELVMKIPLQRHELQISMDDESPEEEEENEDENIVADFTNEEDGEEEPEEEESEKEEDGEEEPEEEESEKEEDDDSLPFFDEDEEFEDEEVNNG